MAFDRLTHAAEAGRGEMRNNNDVPLSFIAKLLSKSDDSHASEERWKDKIIH